MAAGKYEEILEQIKKANGLLVESKPVVSEDPKQDEGKPASAATNKNTTAGAAAEVPGVQVEKLASAVSTAMDRIKGLAESTTKIAAAPASKVKKADATGIELSPEFHFKLASTILETEEGMALAEQLLTKKAGAEVAQTLILNAFEQSEHMKVAAAQEVNAEALELAALEDLETAAGYEKLATAMLADDGEDAITKEARVHAAALASFDTAAEKRAYAEGVVDAADMAEAVDPELAELPAEAGGEISIEDVVEGLQDLIEEGQIDEATAQAILEELLGEELAAEEAGELPAE